AGHDPAGGVGHRHAGRDRVDADVVAAERGGHRLGEVDHAVLGEAVARDGDRLQVRPGRGRRARVGGDRADVDDRAALPPLHVGEDGAGDDQQAYQIDVEDPAEIVDRLVAALQVVVDGGVVDQDVDSAVVGVDPLGQRVHLVLAGDIAAVGGGAAAGGAD